MLIIVAPLVGAWIEILDRKHTLNTLRSLPSWERGLKLSALVNRIGRVLVAPLVGAWIEILAPSFFDTPDTGRSPRGSVD